MDKVGQLAGRLLRLNLVILDSRGFLLCSPDNRPCHEAGRRRTARCGRSGHRGGACFPRCGLGSVDLKKTVRGGCELLLGRLDAGHIWQSANAVALLTSVK